MTRQFITYKTHRLHYYKIGNGEKVMFAFHGFGLDGRCFEPFETQLGTQYTIYSFDLFYHGESYWGDNDKLLTKAFWKEFIGHFTDSIDCKTFSLLGFSLGGKFALATLEAFPLQVDKLIMIAPDGIKTNMWYSLATYPVVFQNYFKGMIVKPQRFYGLLNLLKRMNLLDKGISKFAASQMNTVKKRRRVYYSWIVFKLFTFNLRSVAKIINENDVQLFMYLGKFDKIITRNGMQNLLSKVDEYDLEIVTSGHNDLIKNIASNTDLLTKLLNK